MIDKVVAEIGKGSAASVPSQAERERQRWSPFSRHHGHRLEP
jgi:hypothetical protein